MASKLVEAMTTSYKPDEYRDEYTLALQKMIEAKLEGVEIESPEIPKMEIEDLMAALKASVAQAVKR
jgi:DNA end-binding protein Ku